MSTEFVYPLLTALCVDEEEHEDTMKVIMRFDNMDQCEMVADHLFDTALTSFNEGLPEGWHMDESPEIEYFISPEEIKDQPYVIYKDDSRK